MPRFPIFSELELQKEATATRGEKGIVYDRELSKMAEKRGLQHVGSGDKSTVVRNNINPEGFVTALGYRPDAEAETTREDMIAQFYAHSIFKKLFPDNFPTIHTSWQSREPKSSGTIRTLMEGTRGATKYRAKDLDSDSHKPISRVFAFIEQTKMPINLDGVSCNYEMSPEGAVCYMDTLNVYNTRPHTWIKTLVPTISYMKEHGFSDKDIDFVLKRIARITAQTDYKDEEAKDSQRKSIEYSLEDINEEYTGDTHLLLANTLSLMKSYIR